MSDASPRASAISAEAFDALVHRNIGVSAMFDFRVARLERGLAEIELPFDERFLRPGGTISGPTMMTLADTALYGAVLSILGPVPLAVTTDLSFHFVRRPPAADIRCVARILKPGRRLMVGEFHHYTGADQPDPLICFGSGTYSVPPGQG